MNAALPLLERKDFSRFRQKRCFLVATLRGALPYLIPDGVSARIQHMNLALNTGPITSNLKQAAQKGDCENINFYLRETTVVKEFRQQTNLCLSEINKKLTPLRKDGLQLLLMAPLLAGRIPH